MALMRRDPVPGLIHHSDRGTQYTALSFGQRLEEAGGFPSMGRVGSALDNAMAEAFVASLKAEMEIQTGSRTFASKEAAKTAAFDYIEGFYNSSRIHSSIGNVSPADYEQALAGEVRAA
jgi:transposase InsO family protein